MSRHDAIVIGADVGGLAAAAYLARAGKRVLVLERQAAPPEPVGPLIALDPVMLADLKLARRGLQFQQRDLPLTYPGVSLGRDPHAACALPPVDVRAWRAYRQDMHALARQMRRWWWSGLQDGTPDWVLGAAARARLARLSVTGAQAFLAAHFESDALIAAHLFDATLGGLHVAEPGSALALVWRAAQEMAGLEGAAAMPVPGSLVWSLIKAAGESDFRCCAPVANIVVRSGAVQGVRLAGGEAFDAPLVLSSLSPAATEVLSGGDAPAARIGEARLLLGFSGAVALPRGRLVLAERSDIYFDAHEAARAGRLAAELPMEMAAAAPDRIAVTLRPVPAVLSAEDRIQLVARAVKALSRHVPGVAGKLASIQFSVSATRVRANLAHMLAPSAQRVKTAITGLYLCGEGAEPLPSPSGRAARIAAQLAVSQK